MTNIRTANEIILSFLDFFRTAQPNLDIKPGTVSRDILIDGVSVQISRLYEELARVSSKQSLRLAIGIDLDRLASNFGSVRQRGTKATGPALFTFNSLESDININRSAIVTARNGATFIVTTGIVVSPVFANSFRAIASQNRTDLDLAGITDEFAVEVLVESSAPGIQGNISKFSLASTEIAGVSNVINVTPFGGGAAAEDDAAFRSRILAVFSGANTGTSLGYRNAVMADPSALDAIVIEPGDTLMTRDGTQVSTDEEGNTVIVSEGTGGKVDIYVFGNRLQEYIDSYVFKDLSSTGDPTHSDNNFVLGQILGDEDKTITRKRLDNLESGVLPAQPVNNITQVSGSLSGSNFIEKDVDSFGVVTGNYELLKDTGEFGGSPWGFDKLAWISDRISDFKEDITKRTFNGQDSLSFTDVLEISAIEQKINIVNENSKVVSSDRSYIQLSHFPIINATRVFNVTTGERYVISSQNPDGSGTINNTGRIVISGSSLPATSDILQTDYTWILKFDPSFDFDNRITNRNPRIVRDSVDWGFSNAVRRENATLTASGSVLNVTTTHPISSVVSVNVYEPESSTVTLSSGRLSVIVSLAVEDVVSVIRISDSTELWNTNKTDGSFSGLTIFLPTDTAAVFGDAVTVIYNAEDVFNVEATPGSFNDNVITIVPSATAVAGELVEATYIANVSSILPSTLLSSLPAIRSNNSFNTITSTNIGNQPTSHIFSSPGVVVQNLRQAPSRLALTISGSISPGIITIGGTTIVRAAEIVYTVGTSGLRQNLSSAVRTHLGISSSTSIPSNLKLARLVSVERVSTVSSNIVTGVEHTFDIKGYHIKENIFVKDESVADSGLTATEIILPTTTDNSNNSPTVGQKLRVTFYYTYDSDSENVSFSKSGTLYTNKIFAITDSVAISSGFTSGSSASATLTIANSNQPTSGSRYKATYDYLAPKQNERITIRYNYNKIISDSTLNVENTRPINADVLVKAATQILVDVTINIVVTTEFINNTSTVQQNVQDAVTSALNATALGTTIDSSDLINVTYTIDGVDRARVLFFNKSDEAGTVLSITAGKNEFIVANNVTINIESR